MTDAAPTLATALEAEHRELDELLGFFLAAASGEDAGAAGRAMEEFDERLREHTRREEERLYTRLPGRKLLPAETEEEEEKLSRELRLEHVQIREVSGMMRRMLGEKKDVASALALAGNLARRWEAHTVREESEVFPAFGQEVDDREA